MNKLRLLGSLILILNFTLFISCSSSDTSSDYSYDPDKPTVLESFEPLRGGMATKVILTGENFGNDPSQIKVYFNNKRASVIGCDKGKVLVVTPRQPGDTCIVSVVVGKDSLIYPTPFIYKTSTTVTTLVGLKGTADFTGGSFAETTFANPAFITVDDELNLFVVSWGGTNGGNISVVSQQNKTVTQLVAPGRMNVPTTDITGKIILVPHDSGDDFFMFDPEAMWAPRKRAMIHPTAEEVAGGMTDFNINWKHGFAVCKLDSFIYTRSYSGQLVKFNSTTRKAQLVEAGLMPNSDSYLSFDPIHPEMLYLSYQDKSVIYTYNVKTKEHKRFAGTMGLAGWKDGNRLDALFNHMRQLIFDKDGNIVVADGSNHCIRKITPDGTVTTIIGMGGKAGYQDGNPDDALFNDPRGICIDKNGDIYIADYGNNCVRKLAIQ